MKKIFKWFIIYYIFGFVLVNTYTISSHSATPADILQIGLRIFAQNITNPTFYGVVLVWPVFAGIKIYKALMLITNL